GAGGGRLPGTRGCTECRCGSGAAAERLAVAQLLDVLQVGTDAAVALLVVRLEPDLRAGVAAGVEIRFVDDVLQRRVDDARTLLRLRVHEERTLDVAIGHEL